MSFRSYIPGRIDHLDDTHFLCGALPRDYDQEPFGTLGYAAPFSIPVIDRSEWADRIEADERNQTRIQDLVEYKKIPAQHQGNTRYCWINNVVRCVELLRLSQGQPYVQLSPASCAGPITGYRNQGGYSHRGVEYVVKNGIVPASIWPANAIDKRYDTAQAREQRQLYQVDDWTELSPRNFSQLMTLLLLKIPVATSHNWMRHAVTAVAPLVTGRNQFAVLFHNSGYGRDRNGYTVLSESKATPDAAIAPTVVTAS